MTPAAAAAQSYLSWKTKPQTNKKAHPNNPKPGVEHLIQQKFGEGVKPRARCIPEFCVHFSDTQISPLVDLQLCNVCVTCCHGYCSRFHTLQTDDL